ncbi:MAG: hypothetical protein IJ757_07235 [Clostridiales bacterium]|nr:hypothetical protein [Clostridiales bacterium]
MADQLSNIVKTKYGDLIPCSGASDYRKKYRCPVDHYDNGNVKSVYLEEPQNIDLPEGTFQAELITFYEDGNVKRIFPLYGQLSAFWSLEEELEFAPYYDFCLDGSSVRIRPQCLYFYPSGKIRSITLWPTDKLEIKTPIGTVITTLGIELHENGSIRSIEPIPGTVITTPFGEVRPFIYKELMLHAEDSSLTFDDKGELTGLSTICSSLEHNGVVIKPSGINSPLSIKIRDKEILVRLNDSDIRINTSLEEVRFR